MLLGDRRGCGGTRRSDPFKVSGEFALGLLCAKKHRQVHNLTESLEEKSDLPYCWWWSIVPLMKNLSVAPVLSLVLPRLCWQKGC